MKAALGPAPGNRVGRGPGGRWASQPRGGTRPRQAPNAGPGAPGGPARCASATSGRGLSPGRHPAPPSRACPSVPAPPTPLARIACLHPPPALPAAGPAEPAPRSSPGAAAGEAALAGGGGGTGCRPLGGASAGTRNRAAQAPVRRERALGVGARGEGRPVGGGGLLSPAAVFRGNGSGLGSAEKGPRRRSDLASSFLVQLSAPGGAERIND